MRGSARALKGEEGQMSHYTEIKTQIKDAECAVAALKAVGCTEGMIEVHKEPVSIFDYRNKKTKYAYNDTKDERFAKGDCAHVVIRRNHLGSGHNDFGIYVDGEDSRIFLCDFARQTRAASSFGLPEAKRLGSYEKWLKRFKQEYAVKVAEKRYAKKGKRVSRVDGKDGKIRLYVKA